MSDFPDGIVPTDTTISADTSGLALDDRLYNTADGLSVYDHLKEVRTQIDNYLKNLDIALSEIKAYGTETPRTLSNLYDNLSSILTQLNVTLDQAGKSYLYNATDAKSVYDHLKSILGQLDISLSEIKAVGTAQTPRTLSELYDQLSSILGQLDVALSTRATEATLSAIKNALASVNTDKLLTTPDNPPNLDAKVSTLSTEATLAAIKAALASVATDKLLTTPDNPSNLDIALSAHRDALLGEEQVYQQLLNADESVTQSITLDTKGHEVVSIYSSATTATTFTVELSNDNTNFVTYYTSTAVETSHSETLQTAFKYVKLSSVAGGVSGTDTVTLILGAK